MTSAAARTGEAGWATAIRSRGGGIRLLGTYVALEVRSALRAPEFLAGAIIIPLLLYVMFGLTNDSALPLGTTIRTVMLVSLSAYGVVSLAIFVLGEDVARDRGRGWVRTMRAAGLPPSLHLFGKTLSGVVHAALVLIAMGLLARFGGHVELSLRQWALFTVTTLAGFLAFAPLGLAIAYLARPRTATVVANVIFLPLSFASGFFVPLAELPGFVTEIARFLPTTHFGQLAYRTVMPREDVAVITGVATQPLWVHLAWVLGGVVVCSALALVGARREAVTRRG